MMDNSTTFQGDGEVVYIPVVVNGKQARRTNADKIRAMSDEELAKAVYMGCPEGKSISCCIGVLMREPSSEECQKCWLDWLKQECE